MHKVHVPFIGDLSDSCTSGLVDHEVKSRLRVSLLKGESGNAQMAGCLDVTWCSM